MRETAIALRKVATGLGLIYAGLCLIVFAAFVPAIGGCLFAALGPRGIGIAIIAAGVLMLAGIVLDTVGRLFCLSMPDEQSGAKIIILVAVILDVLALLLLIGNLLSTFMPGTIPPAVGLLGTPLSMAGSVLFLIFLRQLALYVDEPKYARRAITILILGAILFVLLLALVALTLFAAAPPQIVGPGQRPAPAGGGMAIVGILGLVVLVLALVTLIFYGNLLSYLRKAVIAYADGGRRRRRRQDEDEDEEDDRPRRRRRHDEDDDDEDDDDRPRRRVRAAEEEDDEDRPRRPSRKGEGDEGVREGRPKPRRSDPDEAEGVTERRPRPRRPKPAEDADDAAPPRRRRPDEDEDEEEDSPPRRRR